MASEVATLMTVSVLEEISPGNGPSPKVGDKVVVHSTGTLAKTGATFDDSREGGVAYTIAVGVNKSIPGMDAALLKMRKGERKRVLISADDAYGSAGLKPHIPPDADVIYDIELVDINESLVAQGIRARREQEARVQRYLKLQDEARAAEALDASRAGGAAEKRRRRDSGSGTSGSGSESGSESDGSGGSSSESSGARKRRKKEEKRRKERKERKREKREKKSKKGKKERKSKKGKREKERR